MSVDHLTSGHSALEDASGSGLLALARHVGYPVLAASALCSYTTRWGALFVVSYLLTQLVDSPFVTQLAGALLFTPLLFGGFFGGLLTDRFPSRSVVLWVQAGMIPALVTMTVWAVVGNAPVWALLAFMLVMGVGELGTMIAHRRVVYEVVGPALARRAMTVEGVFMAASMAIGPFGGGLFIDRLGVESAFGGLLLLQLTALVSYTRVPRTVAATGRSVSAATQIATSRRLMRTRPRLVALVLVTITMNLCVYGYMPLKPVIAESFESGALFAGLFAASDGVGQLLFALTLALVGVTRPGLVFSGGAILTLLGLLALATSATVGVAFGALFAMGIGTACYGAMQGLLAMETVTPSERGAALGLATTAIGVTPLGMLLVGTLATVLTPQLALTCLAFAGLVLLTTVLVRWRTLLVVAATPADP